MEHGFPELFIPGRHDSTRGLHRPDIRTHDHVDLVVIADVFLPEDTSGSETLQPASTCQVHEGVTSVCVDGFCPVFRGEEMDTGTEGDG